jgi:predicted phage terminase large subunit-like protein
MQLTPEQIAQFGPEALQKVRAELAKRSLLEFTRQAWPILEPGTPMKDGWVLHAICDHLEAMMRGEIKRLVINVPPGASKSRLTRVMLPLHLWTRQPWARVIGASYALNLSERDSYYARTIIQTDWYQRNFGVSISSEQGAKVNFDNSSMGGLRAISVGGATTGFRGDLLILDDAHNASDGESDAKRSEAVQWFLETFQTRVNDLDNTPIVVIGQRIHQEDVYQAAIDLGYEHLNIPMEWDESYRRTTSIGWTDPRSEEGELMWPARFSAAAVERLKRALGPYASAAQLQQTPVPRKGGLIGVDGIKIIDELPDEPFIAVRAWDLAASEGAGAFTVGLKLLYGQKSDRFYIADVKRKQLNAGGVRQMILDTAEEDGIAVKIVLPQDPGQAGKALVEDLIAALTGYNAKAEIQSGAKETRAAPMAAQIDIGRMSVLNRTWTKPLLDEMRFFPKGKYKDQVDAAASAFNELASMTRLKERKRPLLTVVGERQDNWAKVV